MAAGSLRSPDATWRIAALRARIGYQDCVGAENGTPGGFYDRHVDDHAETSTGAAGSGAPGPAGKPYGRLARKLAGVVGSSHVLVDPELRAPYEVDWTGRWSGEASLVVRPASTAELSGVVAACAEESATIVVQGGNTGLVGGSVPLAGEVVVSTARISWVGEVDVASGELSAGAGATLASVQDAARAVGLDVGIDLASRGSATVGGMVATNASGLSAVRFGRMSSRMVALQAVLASGAVVSAESGSRFGRGGYDLASLLAGSEGTLGIVSSVTLGVVAMPSHVVTALVALDAGSRRASRDGTGQPVAAVHRATDAAVSTFSHLRNVLSSRLHSAELLYPDAMELVCARTGSAPPFDRPHDAYLLIECASSSGDDGQLADEIAGALAECTPAAAGAVAEDPAGRRRLWRYREAISESISLIGVPHKLDVHVPLSMAAGLVAGAHEAVQRVSPGSKVIVFGHIGVGNLHLNVIGPAADDTTADDAILELVIAAGGNVSAEHGIGRAKASWLPRVLSSERLDAMRRVKDAMDPKGLMNPGVLLAPAEL